MKNPRFSSKTSKMLLEAGWFEGRRTQRDLKLPIGFEPFDKAVDVLIEFAGINAGKASRGIDCAAANVVIDPFLALGLEEEIEELGKKNSTRFYPLGEVDDGEAFILISEVGDVFVYRGGASKLYFIAPNFDMALERLLLGIRSKN